MDPTTLDPTIVNFAKALKKTETGDGNTYGAKGKSGEFGAYQFMPETYKLYAQKYLGDANAQPTVENQNKITYSFVKDKKDAGFNPAQIASMWNAGEQKPNAYKENYRGVNSQGVAYDVPAYVQRFSQNYNTLKQATGGPQTAEAAGVSQGTTPPVDPNAPDTYGASFKATPGEGPVQAGLKAIGNVPSSTFNLAKGLFNVVRHPINTVEGIGNAFAGGIEEGWNALTGGKANNKQTMTFDALKKALYDRYGTLENAQRSATNDPVGVGSDILAILEGGTTLADKALGTESNAALNAGLLKVAKPVAEGIKTVAAAPFKAAGHALGIETGVGYDPIRQGFQASSQGGESSKAFTDALRGNVPPDELVTKAKSALGEIIDNRSQGYKDMLSKLSQDANDYDITPIKNELGSQLEKFKIRTPDTTLSNHLGTVVQEVDNLPPDEINKLGGLGKLFEQNKTDIAMQLQAEGFKDLAKEVSNVDTSGIQNVGDYVNKVQSVVDSSPNALDFSRSKFALDTAAQKDIQNLAGYVKGYGTQAGDVSALGVDNLKQVLGGYYSPNSDYRAFTEGLRKSARTVLNDAPGYTDAMKNYADLTDNIQDITKSLSLGDKASVETAFKKLTSALKNNDFRLQVIQGLDKDTGGELLSNIAGQRLSSPLPRGLAAVTEGGIAGLTTIFHPAGLLPLLGLAITTSPRVVGEFVRALGIGAKGVNKMMDLLNKFSVPAVTAGNVSNRLNPGLLPSP